jgi:hypothetical protein
LRLSAAELLPSYAASITSRIAVPAASAASPLTAAIHAGGYAEPPEGVAAASAKPRADRTHHVPLGKIALGIGVLVGVALLALVVQRVRGPKGTEKRP